MIAIIDYGAGNIRSVEKALMHIGCEVEVTQDPSVLMKADGAVLPLDLAALYRLQVQGQLLAKNGRLIAPRAELRAAVEQVFRV